MNQTPNILFFMVDQMQAQALDPNHPCRTPHLDQLASQGVRFSRAYTSNAVCSPARAGIMTGRLPYNHGVLWVTHTATQDMGNLRTDLPHWAQTLDENGYQTAYFGKWHVERSYQLAKFGWQKQGLLDESGLAPLAQEVLGHDPKKTVLHGKTLDNPPGYIDHGFYGVVAEEPHERSMGIITTKALGFLDEALNNHKPWCLMVSAEEPHDPYFCSQSTYESYKEVPIDLPDTAHDTLEKAPGLYRQAAKIWDYLTDEEKIEARRCYYASITELDAQLGLLLQKIEDAGQTENTLIVFTTDHGDLLGSHRLFCKNISAYEEVYNVPLIMAGPGITKGALTDARVGTHELYYTLLELAGQKALPSSDGRSFVPVLKDPQTTSPQFTQGLAAYFGSRILVNQRIFWDGDWKLVFNQFDGHELYNLKDDPHEHHNLAEDPDHQDTLMHLFSGLWEKLKATHDVHTVRTHYPAVRLGPLGPEG